MTNLLYQNKENSKYYVFLDGGLRLIPDADTLNALFTQESITSTKIIFSSKDDAPFQILENWPLKKGAKLVNTEKTSDGILLEDVYPWDQNTTVLRHVINPQQMTELGFDWNKVEEYQGEEKFGVPLSVFSNLNINAIQELTGYYIIYNYFMSGGVILNPYFEYLLQKFPGHGGSGSNRNKIFKPVLKALINYWQNVVNQLLNS